MGKSINWPPIISRDGMKIEEGDLLYEPDAFFSTYSDDKHRIEIKVFRVTQINLRYRYARLRCHKGCEDVVHFDKNCRRSGLFKKKERALQSIEVSRSKNLKNVLGKIKQYEKLAAKAERISPKVWPEPALV